MSASGDRKAERVRELLGDPALEVLVDKLDRRLAKRPAIDGRITLKDASIEIREAVTSLLGLLPKRNGPLHIDLRRLDAAIRESGAADGLVDALFTLKGRLPQHSAVERRRERDRWQSAWKTVVDANLRLSNAALAYMQAICQTGKLRRTASGSFEDAVELLQGLARCLAALPCPEPTPLPIFATRVLGDSHALDVDRPLRKLLLGAVAWTEEFNEADKSARALWSSMGVVQDEYASTVLVLNLPAAGDGLLGRVLSANAAAGEPCRITFAQLRRHEVRLEPASLPIFVCENPSIVAAAAERLGDRSLPLICTEGRPSHAAIRLLTACCESQLRLCYHGDIDYSGLQIASHVIERFAAQPWRLSAADYERHAVRSELPWRGPVPNTPWDPRLSEAIEHCQRIVLEEAIVDELLSDLAG